MTYEQSARADRVALPSTRGLSASSLRLVLRRLADRADDEGMTWPSARALAGYSRIDDGGVQRWDESTKDLNEQTARNALAALARAGLIREVQRTPRGRVWQLSEVLVSGDAPRSQQGDLAAFGDAAEDMVAPVSGSLPRSPQSSERGSAYERAGVCDQVSGDLHMSERGCATTNQPLNQPENQPPTPPRTHEAGGSRETAAHSGGDESPSVEWGAGELETARDLLTTAGVNSPERWARDAGSLRCVTWLIEGATSKGIREPAAWIVAKLQQGERPPEDWVPAQERRDLEAEHEDRVARLRGRFPEADHRMRVAAQVLEAHPKWAYLNLGPDPAIGSSDHVDYVRETLERLEAERDASKASDTPSHHEERRTA